MEDRDWLRLVDLEVSGLTTRRTAAVARNWLLHMCISVSMEEGRAMQAWAQSSSMAHPWPNGQGRAFTHRTAPGFSVKRIFVAVFIGKPLLTTGVSLGKQVARNNAMATFVLISLAVVFNHQCHV